MPATAQATAAEHTHRADDAERAHAYSFGMAALLLLYLDKRPAEWVHVATLSSYVGGDPNDYSSVRWHLETLAGNNLVRVQRSRLEGPEQGEIYEAQAALAQTN